MGNPFVHVELNTTDLDRAKKFYGQPFDWELEDAPMGPAGNYMMIKPGEGTGGGMLTHPDPKGPSSWLAYVAVEDVAASTQKAKSRRQGHERRHGSPRRRLDEHHRRSDGRDAGPLEAEDRLRPVADIATARLLFPLPGAHLETVGRGPSIDCGSRPSV